MKEHHREQLKRIIKQGNCRGILCYGDDCYFQYHKCTVDEFDKQERIKEARILLLQDEQATIKALDDMNRVTRAKTTEEKREILEQLDDILHALTYHERCYENWSREQTPLAQHKQVIHTKCIVRWQERFNKLKEQL